MKKPKVLIQISGGIVVAVSSEVDLDWDVINLDDVRDGVEAITKDFRDWAKNLLTVDQIRLINETYFKNEI